MGQSGSAWQVNLGFYSGGGEKTWAFIVVVVMRSDSRKCNVGYYIGEVMEEEEGVPYKYI